MGTRTRWSRVAGLAVASMLVAACGSDDDGAPTTVAPVTTTATSDGGTPTTGPGTTTAPGGDREPSITVAVRADPGQLAFNTSGIGTYTFTRLLYDGLFRVRPSTTSFDTVDPGAAKSWDVSDDGLTYTFTLRDGLRFTNDEALTSEDIAFSIQKLQDPASTQAGFLSNIVGVETPDPATVVLTLGEADPSFWVTMGEVIDIYPADTVQRMGDEAFAQAPIGSGPYSLKSWQPNEEVVFAANDAYWGTPPRYDEIRVRIIPDSVTAVNELVAGNIAATQIEISDLPVVEGDSSLAVRTGRGGQLVQLKFRFENAPTSDVKVRQALNLALDVEAIIDNIYAGKASRSVSIVPEGGFGATTDRQAYAFDPDKARTLLSEAGYDKGELKLKLDYDSNDTNKAIAEAIASMWGDVGVDVELVPMERGVFIKALRGGTKAGTIDEVALFTWNGVTDSLPIYQFNVLNGGPYAYANVPAVDAAISDALSATSADDREAAIQEAEDACYDAACVGFLFAPQALFGTRSDVTTQPHPEGLWDLTSLAPAG